MASYLFISEKYKTAYLHSGFFVCLIAFLMMITCPSDCRAIDIQLTEGLEQRHTDFRLQNAFLSEPVGDILFRTKGKIYLPYSQKLQFSSNIYHVKKYSFLPELVSSLEYNKRQSITDFGVTGIIKWPLIQQKNWSININGKVSGSQQYSGPAHQKSRWDFEHQIGWDANYQLGNALQVSLGIYHYRIINNYLTDNPAQAYISSGGGFASLHLQF